MTSIRPRRSVLYMPGANQRALEKARTLPADTLILDLEDAVAPAAKVEARQRVVDAVKSGGYGHRELVIRVNGLDTPWGIDDVKAVAECGADAMLFPKVETAEGILRAVEVMDDAGIDPATPVWAMIETPRGVLNIQQVTAAHPRLTAIVMGTSDLAKDTRARHTPDRIGFIASLSLCLLAARAQGLEIFDGVHLDLADEEGYVTVCQQGRDLGFDGKTLIHPKQIAAANAAFGPSEEDAKQAREIITAWEQAQVEGKGVVVVNGRLVENLHVEEAERTLLLWDKITEYANA